MERTEVLDMMGELKLYGMRNAYDEALATAVKRKHEPQHFVGDLLKAEISEKQARSIKYQLTIAKLPLAKDIDDFTCKGTPINESLVRDLAGGNFIAQQRKMSSWLGGRARARRIWRSRSHEVVSAPDLAVASSPRSILSTGSRLKVELAAKAGWQLGIHDHEASARAQLAPGPVQDMEMVRNGIVGQPKHDPIERLRGAVFRGVTFYKLDVVPFVAVAKRVRLG